MGKQSPILTHDLTAGGLILVSTGILEQMHLSCAWRYVTVSLTTLILHWCIIAYPP